MNSKFATLAAMQAGKANRATIRKLVRAAGLTGIAMSALKVATGFSDNKIGRHLRALHEAGAIEPSHSSGRSVRWGVPGIFASHQAHRDRTAARRRLHAEIRQSEVGLDPVDVWAEQLPRRVFVAAVEARPIRPRGPVSVWDAGRMAA